MPHTNSARKHLRKSNKRRRHNRAVKRTVKDETRSFLDLVETGKIDEARKELNLVAKKLDKAAARGIVHANLAARKKSRLAAMLNKKASAGKPAAAPAKGAGT
jgi:small subunit ribosomal protein S20